MQKKELSQFRNQYVEQEIELGKGKYIFSIGFLLFQSAKIILQMPKETLTYTICESYFLWQIKEKKGK